MSVELSELLDHIEQIGELDRDSVAPTAYFSQSRPGRPAVNDLVAARRPLRQALRKRRPSTSSLPHRNANSHAATAATAARPHRRCSTPAAPI